jgi:Xaa-Pro dipeptidase
MEYAIWMGEIKPPSAFQARYEVDHALHVDELIASLREYGPDMVYLNRGLNTDSGSYATPAQVEGLEEFPRDTEKLNPEIVECRVIKSPEELRVLQYANDISSEAHIRVMQHVRPGQFEYQLESLFLHHGYYFGACRNTAYTCICGCGPNSSVLHYGHAAAPNDRVIQADDMLLLDMGAEYHCYASDITCSFPASGRFSPDQRFIFEAVQAMQFAVMDALRPGVAWKDMHGKPPRSPQVPHAP